MGRKRGRGEGGIWKRADGRWEGRVDLGWQDGKRKSKSTFGPTRKAVADKLVDVHKSVQDGEPLPNERTTVAAFLDRWLASVQNKLRPRAWATYEQAVRLHLSPGIGHERLARLRPLRLEQWMKAAQDKGTSARTIGYARRVLRIALNQACRWELVRKNVAALVQPPKHTAKRIQPLTPEQARALLAVAKGDRLEALITVATALGLRIGEATGLRKVEDIDFKRAVLRVQQTLERSGGDRAERHRLVMARRALRATIATTPKRSPERRALREQLETLRTAGRKVRTQLRVAEPKSERSRRTIYMPGVVVTALKAHFARQRVERLAAGRYWHDSGFVFTTPIGTPLDPRNATREFHRLCRAAKIPPVRFHDLRHTAATLLLVQGVNPRVVMETLGHSQISLTLNTYSHVLPALQQDAAAKLDAILKS